MLVKIHPTAEVQTEHIGEGTTVWQHCVILQHAVIGKNVNINFNVFIENDVQVGDNVTIKCGVQLWDGLRISDNVFIGPNVTFTNDRYPRSGNEAFEPVKTIVEEGASIGANATILCGLTICKYSVIGAGSVITRDVPPFNLWYGNPAKQKGYVTRHGIFLDSDLTDKNGNGYHLVNDEPVIL